MTARLRNGRASTWTLLSQTERVKLVKPAAPSNTSVFWLAAASPRVSGVRSTQ
jgi:hypothetical protein